MESQTPSGHLRWLKYVFADWSLKSTSTTLQSLIWISRRPCKKSQYSYGLIGSSCQQKLQALNRTTLFLLYVGFSKDEILKYKVCGKFKYLEHPFLCLFISFFPIFAFLFPCSVFFLSVLTFLEPHPSFSPFICLASFLTSWIHGLLTEIRILTFIF